MRYLTALPGYSEWIYASLRESLVQQRSAACNPVCTTAILGLMDGVLERLLAELGNGYKVVATGGLASLYWRRLQVHQAGG